MNFAQLRQLIKAKFTEGVFFIAEEDFSSTPIKNLFKSFLPLQRLHISAAAFSEEKGKTVTISGKIALFEAQNLNAKATFFTYQNQPHLRLKVDGFLPDWRLSHTFPKLAQDFLDSFNYRHPVFTLDSTNANPLPQDFQVDLGLEPNEPELERFVSKGLSFEAEIQLGIPWDMLAGLINSERIIVSGSVEIKDDVPRFWLRGKLGKNLSIGNFSFPFELQLISILTTTDEEDDNEKKIFPETMVRLLGDFSYKSGDTDISLPLSARWYSPNPTIFTFEAGLEDVSKLAFSNLEELLKIDSLSQYIPDAFPSLSNIAIKDLRFDVDLNVPTITAIQWVIAIDYTWEIIPGIFTVSNLEGVFSFINPLTPSSNNFSAAIYGDVTLGGKTFNLFATFPDLTFGGSLAEGQTISLSDIVAEILPGDFGLPALNCTDLTFYGSLANKSFTISSTIEGEWAIPVGIADLRFEELFFDLTRAKVDKSYEITGYVGGKIGIGSASFQTIYSIPGGLVLRGQVPKINLAETARTLAGPDIIPGFPVSLSVLDFDITDIEFEINFQARSMFLSAVFKETLRAEFSLQYVGGKWGFAVGIYMGTSFKLSDIWSALGFLDGLSFENPYFLVSLICLQPAKPSQSTIQKHHPHRKGLQLLPAHAAKRYRSP